MDPLTLYVDSQYVSPYAMSAFVGLMEKGLPFETRTVDLAAGEQRAPEYLSISLSGRVPTLLHGTFALSESNAITEYLEDVFPGPAYARLYPREPRERARARQLQAWMRSDFMPIREERTTAVIFLDHKSGPLSAAAQAAADRLFRAADSLIEGERDHVFGDWCIADTDLALMINRLLANGDAVPFKLARYAIRQWQRPSVQRWVKQVRSVHAAA